MGLIVFCWNIQLKLELVMGSLQSVHSNFLTQILLEENHFQTKPCQFFDN